jgi:hypothetical protein
LQVGRGGLADGGSGGVVVVMRPSKAFAQLISKLETPVIFLESRIVVLEIQVIVLENLFIGSNHRIVVLEYWIVVLEYPVVTLEIPVLMFYHRIDILDNWFHRMIKATVREGDSMKNLP